MVILIGWIIVVLIYGLFTVEDIIQMVKWKKEHILLFKSDYLPLIFDSLMVVLGGIILIYTLINVT